MNTNSKTVRYLPLGDSYTIGEGIAKEYNFPSILTKALIEKGIKVELLDNPAVTGYTTQDVINQELHLLESLEPNFCTLLIGVNDWVQGVNIYNYAKNLEQIINLVTERVKQQLILITIPDFSVTPEGPKYSKGRDISQGLAEFNNLCIRLAKEKKIELVDIFSLSQKQGSEEYVADDQLHPSAKAYTEWVEAILPIATKVLSPSHRLDE